MFCPFRGFIYKSMKNTNNGLHSCPLFEYKMDYIEDHKNIELWDT